MAPNDSFYKTLNLKDDCSDKDVKNAYIELSKKYHPDLNRGNHEAFLKINEAYSILGKPDLRRMYDQFLSNNVDRQYHHLYDNVYSTRNDFATYANRRKMANSPYYSIKGLKKVSNSAIVLVCVAFAAIGLGVEFYALRSSLSYSQEKLQHDSARNQIFYEIAKKQAVSNGNKRQIEKVQDDTLRGVNLKEVNEMYARRLLEKEINDESKI